jgi:hypothetical protein
VRINKMGRITIWLHFFITLLLAVFHFFNGTYSGPFYPGVGVKIVIFSVFREVPHQGSTAFKKPKGNYVILE